MLLSSWIARVLRLPTRHSRRQRRASRRAARRLLRPHLETLEDRTLLSVGMVASNNNNAVGIFNPDTNTPIATVSLPGGSSATGSVAITADQKLGFVTQFNSTVKVIDLTTDTLAGGTNSIPIANYGESLAITPDQQYLVVSDGSASQPLSVVSIASRSQVSTFNTGGEENSVAVGANGDVVYTAFYEGTVHRLTIDSSGTLHDTNQGFSFYAPMKVILAPNGQTGVVVSFYGNDIESFTVSGMTPDGSAGLSGNGITGVFSPDGSRFYARSANGPIDAFAFNQTTGQLGSHLFTVNDSGAISFFGMNQLAISADGSELYVPTSGNTVDVRSAADGHLITTITFSISGLTGIAVSAAPAGTYVVTTTADSGSGSLRQAISNADAYTGGTATILFDIPTSDPGYNSTTGTYTITPLSALPALTNAVILDATSEPGFKGAPVIVLSGASAGSSAVGLDITGGNSTVKGLVINKFGGDGIDLTTNGGDVIEGDYIGTDATGAVAAGNGGNGVFVTSADNTIGGTTAAARNVISGNTANGVAVSGSSATGNVVEGNFIGTDRTGTLALGNSGAGVRISSSSGNTIGGKTAAAQNIISDNTGAGVAVVGATSIKNSITSDSINYNTGGGINNSSGAVTVSNCTLTGNSAGSGGGIYNHAGTMTVSNSTLSSNSAVNHGGGIYNDSTLTVNNSIFSGNSSGDGDDIYNSGTLAVNYNTAGFNGTLVIGNAATGTATFSDASNFSGNLTVNNPGNLQSLSVTGTITAGSSITVLGTLSDSTIGANSGTVSAGSISGMTVTTNSTSGSILASGSITSLTVTTNSGAISLAGTGTASNVSIGTNNGTFEVGEASNPDAGLMTSTTLGTNNGTVSAGTISGMTVTLNNTNGNILAGSINDLFVTKNAGHIVAHGQSTTTNTSIGTNTGTVSSGSISTMTVTSNSGSISAAGAGTTTDVQIGTNSGTFVAWWDSGSAGSGTMVNTSIGSNSGTVKAGDPNASTDGNVDTGSMLNTTIGTNSGAVSTGAINSMSVTANNKGGNLLAGSINKLHDSKNAGHIVAHGQSTTTNTSIGTNTGTVSSGSISTMTVTSNSGSISAAGAGTTTDVQIGTNSGTFVAWWDSGSAGSGTMVNTSIGSNSGTVKAGDPNASTDGNVDTGSMLNSTIGTNSGSISTGAINSMSVTANNKGGNLLAGSINKLHDSKNAGHITAHGQSTTTNTSIGTNTGTVSSGSISTMTVTSNSGSISAAGAGTTTDVQIGTNSGTFVAWWDSGSAGSGTMTGTSIGSNSGTVKAGDPNASTDGNVDTGSMLNTTIGTNSGAVSTGAINSMSVTANKSGGNLLAGSINGLHDSKNAGHIVAHGQSTTTNTSIGTNTGTVSSGSISTMTVTSNSGSISAAGAGTTTDVQIGTNSGTFVAWWDSGSAGSGTMTGTSIGSNSGTVKAGDPNASTDGNVDTGSMLNTTIGTNSGAVSTGAINSMSVTANKSGGNLLAGSINGLSDKKNFGKIAASGQGNAANVTIGTLGASGLFTATGTLASLNVTVFNGLVAAGHIDSIIATNAPGASRMLNLEDGGVTRQLVLTPATTGGSLPQSVNYVYDHNPTSGDAQFTMAVNDGTNTSSYDVELLSSSAAPGSGFDLAALYNAASTPAHIRNVLIEGNLAPYSGDASQVGVTSSSGGVQLPGTALASVGILGNAPAGSVQAASVEAVSFASLTESSGTVAASTATPTDAAQLLAPGTAIVQANNTFLAAAGQTTGGQSQPVALFLDTGTSGAFDSHDVLLGNQGSIDPYAPSSNPVLAQVAATGSSTTPSTIQTINLTGNGGSIQTAQVIVSAITSSGDLGDLTLQATQGIEANITAPSIFGNIAATDGGISGTIQSTAGSIGRVLYGSNGSITGVTTIQAAAGFTGTILSATDLISQVNVNGGDRGNIGAGGNLGYLQLNSNNTISRFGGMNVTGGFYGDAIFLGNIYGDINISGGLRGRIAAQGEADGLGSARQGILGNMNISGGVSSGAAIVSGGEIGDVYTGTSTNFVDDTTLDISGGYKGILAAVGQITYEITGSTKGATIVKNATGANLTAIDQIFINHGNNQPIVGPLNSTELTVLLANLNLLHVGTDGNLSDQ